MDNQKHYKHQLSYFKKEFSSIHAYHIAPWQESYIERIKKYMLDSDYKNKTLLDIATGSGYIAIEMAKLGLKVIACDLNPEAIKNINKYKKQFSLPNLTIMRCKAEKIPLNNESVDYIVANAILEHIIDEKETIDEWKRVVKKNGKLFITVPLKYRFIWPILWLANYIHDKRIGHLRRYDLKSLKEKFNLEVSTHFYTGHLEKVIGVILSMLFKANMMDNFFEKMDKKKQYHRYGSNNISVILIKK